MTSDHFLEPRSHAWLIPGPEAHWAKLAFEKALIDSGLRYSIVRPTAFFKSLSGQIERVRRGKPFLLFGDGRLTSCKPVSDADLGAYLAACVDDPARHNRVLPIGGPGPAITPREQGEALFRLIGRPARFKQVPVGLLDAIIAVLDVGGRVVPRLADKAELARIGRYYATESMLVLDPVTGRYDAEATPSTGSETLLDYYARVVAGDAAVERDAASLAHARHPCGKPRVGADVLSQQVPALGDLLDQHPCRVRNATGCDRRLAPGGVGGWTRS